MQLDHSTVTSDRTRVQNAFARLQHSACVPPHHDLLTNELMGTDALDPPVLTRSSYVPTISLLLQKYFPSFKDLFIFM